MPASYAKTPTARARITRGLPELAFDKKWLDFAVRPLLRKALKDYERGDDKALIQLLLTYRSTLFRIPEVNSLIGEDLDYGGRRILHSLVAGLPRKGLKPKTLKQYDLAGTILGAEGQEVSVDGRNPFPAETSKETAYARVAALNDMSKAEEECFEKHFVYKSREFQAIARGVARTASRANVGDILIIDCDLHRDAGKPCRIPVPNKFWSEEGRTVLDLERLRKGDIFVLSIMNRHNAVVVPNR